VCIALAGTNKEEGDMLFNSCTVMSEAERRYEFVSKGAQTARWLRQLAKDRLRAWVDGVAQSVGKTLTAVGTELEHRRQLDSTHV
jgi:hypothetical protein